MEFPGQTLIMMTQNKTTTDNSSFANLITITPGLGPNDYFEELPIPQDFGTLFPNVFTDPSSTNPLLPYHNWINLNKQKGYIKVTTEKVGNYWTANIESNDSRYGFATGFARETKKSLALGAAAILFREQCLTAMAYYRRVYPDPTTFRDALKSIAIPPSTTLALDSANELDNDLVTDFGTLVMNSAAEAGATGLDQQDTSEAENTTLGTIAQTDKDTVVEIDRPIHSNFIDGGVATFPELTNRYIHVRTIEWPTSMPAGTLLAAIDMPLDAVRNNTTSPNVAPFFQYTFSRPHMKHQLLLNATEFHGGTLILAARYNNDPHSTNIESAYQLPALPHTILQASSANTADIDVPFMLTLPWMPNNDSQAGYGLYYHTLYIGVLNPLNIGTGGTSTVTAQLFTKFSTETDHTAFAMLRTRVDLQTPTVRRLGTLKPNGVAMSAVSKVAGTVSGVAGEVEKAATGIGARLRSNNQDRPLIPHDTPFVALRNTLNMAIGDGAMDAVSMRLEKDKLCPFPSDLMPVQSHEYSIDFLKKVKGVFGGFEWSTSDTYGTVLMTMPVTPILGLPIGDKVSFTPLTELASNFTYYSGNINLHLLFGSSAKHSGRLLIVFHPDEYMEADAVKNRYDYGFVAFDLETQLDVSFPIPNSCPTHLTPIFYTDDLGRIQGVYTYGYVSIIVETPLKIINSISTRINAVAMVNGFDNMEFYAPRNSAIRVSSATNFGTLVPNAGRTEASQQLTTYDIVGSPDFTIGETPNLFTCSRRMMPIVNKTVTTTVDDDLLFRMPVNFGLPGARDQSTAMDLVTQMHDGYRFAKGSVHYYIVCDAPGFVVKHNPRVDTPTRDLDFTTLEPKHILDYAGCATQQVLTAVNGSVNIVVPYYNMHSFLTNDEIRTSSANYWSASRYKNGNLEIILQYLKKGVQYRLTIYRALGDDAEMFCFQGFPLRSRKSMNERYNNYIPVNKNGQRITVNVGPMFQQTTDSRINNTSLAVIMAPRDYDRVKNGITGRVRVFEDVEGRYWEMSINNPVFVDYVFRSNWNGRKAIYIPDDPGMKVWFRFGCSNYKATATKDYVVDRDVWNKTEAIVSFENYWDSSGLSFTPPKVTLVGYDSFGAKKFSNDFTAGSDNNAVHSAYQNLDAIRGGSLEVIVTPSNPPFLTSDLGTVMPNCTGSECLPIADAPGLTTDVKPEDFPDNACQTEVTPQAVWQAIRKTAGLRRKFAFKDVSLKHAQNKYAGLARKVRQVMLFGDVNALEKELKPNVGLFEAASSGISLLTGNLTQAASSMLTGITAYRAVGTMNSVTRAADTLTDTLNNIPNLVKTGASSVHQTISTLGSLIVDAITTRLRDIVPAAVSTVISTCTHLYCLLASSEVSVKVSSFIGLLCSMGVFTLSLAPQLWNLISNCTQAFGNNNLTPNGPEDDLACADHALNVWLRFLVPALLTLVGAPREFANKGIAALGPVFFSLVRGANDMTRFANANMDFIREVYFWWIGETKPEIPANLLLSDKAEELKLWTDRVLKITQGHMRDTVFASTGQQKELDLLYREGMGYLTLYRVRNMDSAAFMTIFRRLVDLHSAVGQRVGRGRLIKEPISFWFYGKSGVGKSNLATKVLVDALIEMGVVYDGPAVYVRNHTDYWNGWADQPAVLWDDWGQNQSEQFFATSVSEFFSITSIAEYNANMPAIEDKNRMVNPYVVGICSNRATFRTNVVLESSALARRRDFLIECKFAPVYAQMVPPIDSASDPRITAEDLASFNHLRFSLKNRQNENVVLDGCENLTYDELMVKVRERVAVLRTRLDQAATARLNQQTALTPEAWRQRLQNSLVPPEQVESVTAALNIEAGEVTLTDAINRQAGTVTPNCDACLIDGNRPEPNHDMPYLTYWDTQVYEDAGEEPPEPPSQEGFVYEPNVGCICRAIIEHGEWCPTKFAYHLAPGDNPWFQAVPPQLFGRNPDGTLTAEQEIAVANGEIDLPPQPVRYYARSRPQDIFVRPTQLCSGECTLRAADADYNTFGMPGEGYLSWEAAKTRWQEFSATWDQRYPHNLIPISGRDNMDRFFQRHFPHGAPVDITQQARQMYALSPDFAMNFAVMVAPYDWQDAPVGIPDPGDEPDPYAHLNAAMDLNIRNRRDEMSWSKLAIKLGIVVVVTLVVWAIYRMVWSLICYFFPNLNWVVANGIEIITRYVFSRLLQRAVTEIVTLVGNVASSGDVRTTRANVTARVVPHVTLTPNGPGNDPVSVIDSLSIRTNNSLDIQKKIYRNTMVLEMCSESGEGVQVLQMFSPGGRICLMPWHYEYVISQNLKKRYISRLHIWNDASRSVYEIDMSCIKPIRINKKDMCYFYLPKTIPAFPNLKGVFAEARDAGQRFGKQALLISGHDRLHNYNLTSRLLEDVQFVNGTANYDFDGEKNEIEILGYQYNYAGAGVCMSVLVDTRTRHILGFHTTGTPDDKVGYSIVFPREYVAAILASEVESPSSFDNLSEAKTEVRPNSSVMEEQLARIGVKPPIVKRLPPNQELRTSITTNIRPSPMTGVLGEPKRFPAKLSDPDKDKRPGYGPLAEAVAKGFSDYTPFPQDFVDIAADDLTSELLAKAKPMTIDPQLCRTNEQAVVGLKGTPFCEGLRLNTSPGWPLCVLKPGSNKTSFIETDEARSYVKFDPVLARMVEKEEDERRRGIVPFSVYADFGKDERLKPGKGMRLINGCPLSQTILWRKYCMDFFAAFQGAQLKVGSAIGLNPFGSGMQEMAQKLLAVGPNILTGDYKNFGPTVHPEVLAKLADVMNAWYRKFVPGTKEEHDVANRVRMTLVESIMNSYHVAGDLVYQTYMGSPSGNPYTAPINTFCAVIYLRVVWQDIFKSTPLQGLAVFHKNFAYICYGDDFVGSISAELLPKFNNVTMSESFAKYKLIFTNPQKDGGMELACPIEKASFLKCTFARHYNRDIYVAHLDMDVIRDIPNWYRLPVPDEMAHLKELADQVLRFLALYGPDVYNENASKLREWFAERGHHLPVNSWTCVDQVFDGEGSPGWIDLWW